MRWIPESPRRSRPGFTLIELLVVIAIIAVLMGLLLAGIMAVRKRGIEVQIRSDLSQLNASITQFNFEYHVDFVPSYVVLKNDYIANPPMNQIELDSMKYLKRLWPRIQYPLFNAALGLRGWFPDDQGASANSSYTLTGDQCLVFFLGGIQQGGACRGFSVNASNPTILTGSRKQLFDFPVGRLQATSTGPFVYLDPQGTPYAYFSNYGIDNGYNRYATLLGTSDCPSLVPNGAYYDPMSSNLVSVPPQYAYYNKSSCQIISAGIDQTFGPGGNWNSRNGQYTPTVVGAVGDDDLTNFHDRMMGAGTVQ